MIDFEKKLLNTVLIEPDSLIEIAEILSPQHFSTGVGQKIFDYYLKQYHSQSGIDAIQLLIDLPELEKEINELDNYPGSIYTIKTNASKIIDAYQKRQLEKISNETKEKLKNEDIMDVIEYAQSSIFELTEQGQAKKEKTVEEISRIVIPRLEQIESGDVSGFAVKTGFIDLDKKIIGFKKGELIILAARPSMGKTSLALNIMSNIAKTDAVAMFSLEMPEDSIYLRLLSAESGVSYYNILTGKISNEKRIDFSRAINTINKLKIIVDDTASLSILDFQTKARKLKRKHNIKAVFVDYLQLMRAKSQTREQEISQISQALKKTAKDIEVPVIALAQLNRSVEMKSDKMPELSHLRESGAIEQDADFVSFLYRPSVYGLGDKGEDFTQLIISKQRNGPLGVVELSFQEQIMKFYDYSKYRQSPI